MIPCRPLPETLENLRPWLTDQIHPLSLTGVNISSCLSFLPSLIRVDPDDIPEVPAPHLVTKELPYHEKTVFQEAFVRVLNNIIFLVHVLD